MGLLKRTDIVDFIDITPTGQSRTWVLLGDGMITGTWTYEAGETSETYIIHDNATTTVDNYNVTLDGEMKCKKGDGAFDYIDGLRRTRAVGSAAETNILSIYKYDVDENDKYAAETSNATISISSFGGDGGATPTIGFTISKNGDPTIGKATITNGEPAFTPTV